MIKLLYVISSWCELAILIPLFFIIKYKPRGGHNRPLVIYTIIATVINVLIIAIAKNKGVITFLPKSNHFLYNLHSITKVFFIGWYIISFKTLKLGFVIKPLIVIFTLFSIYNFIFLQPFIIFSVRIANIESILILLFCSSFFLATILDNSPIIWMYEPPFKVCAGANLYAAMSFFVFLFFHYLNVYEKQIHDFFSIMIIISSFSYVILCIIIAYVLKNKPVYNYTPQLGIETI